MLSTTTLSATRADADGVFSNVIQTFSSSTMLHINHALGDFLSDFYFWLKHSDNLCALWTVVFSSSLNYFNSWAGPKALEAQSNFNYDDDPDLSNLHLWSSSRSRVGVLGATSVTVMPCPCHALPPLQHHIPSSLQNQSFLGYPPRKSNHKRTHLPVKPSFLASLPLSSADTPFGANFIEENGGLGPNKQSHSIDISGFNFGVNAYSLPFKLEIENPSRMTIKNVADRITSLPTPSKDCEIRNISQFNDLFMAFVSAEELDLALKLLSNISFYGLVPNSRTFSIMIRCYCEKRDLDGAAMVLDQMLGSGCNPNDATITVLVNSFCKRGKIQKALEMFELVGRIGRKPTVQAYNCLLKGLCYVGRVEEACEKLTEMKKDRLVPDVYTYTALMNGLCKVGRSDEAMELLNEAEENGLTPSVVTFNTLFNGYCKEGRPLDGIHVLKKMKQMNCRPDRISYCTLLHGLIRWGEIETALRTYKEMVSLGIGVDEKMMNTFMRALCRRSWKEKDLLEDAHQVFEEMKNQVQVIEPSTYGLVITTLCSGNKTPEALANLRHMIKKGHSPRAVTVGVIIQALCHRGSTDEALCVLGLVGDQHGIPPGKVSYDLLIGELNKQGMWISARSVYGSALKRGVKPTKRPR